MVLKPLVIIFMGMETDFSVPVIPKNLEIYVVCPAPGEPVKPTLKCRL